LTYYIRQSLSIESPQQHYQKFGQRLRSSLRLAVLDEQVSGAGEEEKSA
jgi:hypothetical protein